MVLLRKVPVLLLALASLALGACGGGGGGSSANAVDPGSGSPNNPPPGTGGGSNEAPSIDGTPGGTVLAGETYTFTPSAEDADGDDLSFTAENLPAWATLNESTGAISGTPTQADAGTYEGITITVSDGTASDTLGPFTISVSAPSSGSAVLSWTPPTENTDGSVLLNLAGYEIRYGQESTALTQTIVLEDPTLSVYVLEDLAPGTWYFSVVAINTDGFASTPSSVASKTIS